MQILGMAVDSAGALYVTGSATSVQVPDFATASRLAPNAFLLKIDPTPDQCDLRVEAQPGGSFVPGDTVRLRFTVRNNGPASADGVVFSLRGGCKAASYNLGAPRVQAVAGTVPMRHSFLLVRYPLAAVRAWS